MGIRLGTGWNGSRLKHDPEKVYDHDNPGDSIEIFSHPSYERTVSRRTMGSPTTAVVEGERELYRSSRERSRRREENERLGLCWCGRRKGHEGDHWDSL